jgi:MscS family membrane protein
MKENAISYSLNKLLFALLLLILFSNGLYAQLLPTGKSSDSTTEEAVFPPDSLDRRNPRGTVNGFIQAVADQNYIRASRYLNLKRSWRSTGQRKRIVLKFQALLDQGGDMRATSLISDKPTGLTDDDLAENQDIVGTLNSDGTEITLYVENTGGNTAANPPLWQFSSATVATISASDTDETSLLNRYLPDNLKEQTLGGVPVGHWLAVVILVVLSYLVSWLLVALGGLILRGIWKKARQPEKWLIVRALGLPLRLYITVLLFVEISKQAGISIIIRQRFSAITVTIGIAAILILLWRLTDILSDYIKNRMTIRKRISAISVILFVRRMAKTAIVIIGIIALLGAVGFDVTTWIAALGIGGLALALGAQKTVENFVGSVSLIADQTIRVGDFCRVGEIKGTVESIGMRSTRLRTPERTIVTIPNGQFASTNVENYAHRDRFLFNPILELRMETTPDELRKVLQLTRDMLHDHEKVINEGSKVRLTGFTANGYKTEIYCYVQAGGIDEAQEIQEGIYLQLLDIVAQSGTDFAYPSQTLYMTQDKGISMTDTVKNTIETKKDDDTTQKDIKKSDE